jgi:hypothetical protein
MYIDDPWHFSLLSEELMGFHFSRFLSASFGNQILHFQKLLQRDDNRSGVSLDSRNKEGIDGGGGVGQFRQPPQYGAANRDVLNAPQDGISQQLGINVLSNDSFIFPFFDQLHDQSAKIANQGICPGGGETGL